MKSDLLPTTPEKSNSSRHLSTAPDSAGTETDRPVNATTTAENPIEVASERAERYKALIPDFETG